MLEQLESPAETPASAPPPLSLKTRAVVFPEKGSAELQELELPSPTPRDIVVEVEASGVSVGTERWAYLGKRSELSFPNVPGYIGIGRVIQAGAEAEKRGYAVGDRVNFFRSRLVGQIGKNSWMASHLARAVVDVYEDAAPDPEALDIHHCEKLPEGLDPVDAALSGLGGVALRGIEMAGVPMGAKVLVAGLGVIGQFAAQMARLKGAKVAVADIVPERLEIAKANGADWAFDSSAPDWKEKALAIAPNRFDIIIDTSSVSAVVNDLFHLLRLRGKFVFQGWYPPPTPLDLNLMHGRLPTCYFPCAHSGAAVQATMQWIRDGKLNVRNLTTHVVRPEDAPEIYRRIAAGSEGFLGVVFDWRKK